MSDDSGKMLWPSIIVELRDQLDQTGILSAPSFDAWAAGWIADNGLPGDCRAWLVGTWLMFGIACGRLAEVQERWKGKAPGFGEVSQAKDPPPDR